MGRRDDRVRRFHRSRRIGSERMCHASLMRAIAVFGAVAPESGWFFFASRRYARAISSREAVRATPRTASGSISATRAAVYAATLAILSPVIMKRAKKPAEVGDPGSTVEPSAAAAAAVATVPSATDAPIDGAQLDAAILRFLRRFPNETMDLHRWPTSLASSRRDPARGGGAWRRGWWSFRSSSPARAGGAELTRSAFAG